MSSGLAAGNQNNRKKAFPRMNGNEKCMRERLGVLLSSHNRASKVLWDSDSVKIYRDRENKK